MSSRVRVAACLVVAAVGTWNAAGSAGEDRLGNSETASKASRKVKAAQAALAAYQNEEPAPAAVGPKAASSVRSDELLKQEQELRAIRAEKLSKDVLRTIEAVRKESSRDPDSGLAELKRTLTSVVSSTDIDPDARERLRAKVQASIDQLLVTREKIEQLRLRSVERNAAEE